MQCLTALTWGDPPGGTYCPCPRLPPTGPYDGPSQRQKHIHNWNITPQTKEQTNLWFIKTIERHSRWSGSQFFGTNYTEFLQKHLFVDSFGASVKTEKGWTATQSVCLSINTISTLRVRWFFISILTYCYLNQENTGRQYGFMLATWNASLLVQ